MSLSTRQKFRELSRRGWTVCADGVFVHLNPPPDSGHAVDLPILRPSGRPDVWGKTSRKRWFTVPRGFTVLARYGFEVEGLIR